MGLGPKVTLTFAGDDSRLSRTIKSVESKTSSLGAKLKGIGKGASMLAAAGSGLNVIGGAVGAVTALSGAALLLPGAALAGAAAMQTFKLATAGFGDAIGAGLSGDMAAFAEATKKMHPEMRKAAATVSSFRPQVDGLKKAVQGGFWDQFSVGIKSAGSTYLPLLTNQLPKLSTELGNMAKQAVNASTTPFFTGAVSSILGNTTTMFAGMRSAAADVLTGLVGIGQIGSAYLPMLGQSIGGVTTRFKEWVTSFEGRNQIQAWINGGILAFKQLGMIAANIGSTLGSVFTGLGGSVDNPLAKIVLLTQKLAELAASQTAQQALTALGVAAQAAGLLMGSTLLAALSALLPVIIALAPLITTIATVMAEWAPVLGPLVVAAYAFGQAISLVTTVMGAYNAIMAVARAGTIITVATTVGGWIAMAAGAMVNAAIIAASWLIAFAPIVLVGALVVGLVALVVMNWAKIKAATVAAWNAVSSAVSSAWSSIKSAVSSAVSAVVSALTNAWNTARSTAVAAWNGIVSAIRTGISTAIGIVRALPGQILSALGNLGSLLVGAGRSLIEGLWRGIQGAIGWVKGLISGALTSIRNLFPFSPAKEGPFSGKGYTIHSGEALMTDFGKGMESGGSGLKGVASTALGGAQGALSSPTTGGRGGGGMSVTFTGNTSDALATVFMQMVREGKIQLKAA